MKITKIIDSMDIEQIVIDNENGTFVSMSKETYDAQQAELAPKKTK